MRDKDPMIAIMASATTVVISCERFYEDNRCVWVVEDTGGAFRSTEYLEPDTGAPNLDVPKVRGELDEMWKAINADIAQRERHYHGLPGIRVIKLQNG